MLFKLSERMMLVRGFHFSKALYPILFTLLGTVMFFKKLQLEKA